MPVVRASVVWLVALAGMGAISLGEGTDRGTLRAPADFASASEAGSDLSDGSVLWGGDVAPGSADASTTPARTAPTQVDPVPGPAYGTYAWPVRGPVLRGFDPPDTPYGSGHRGIDIQAPLGTTVVAAQAGTVAFAGLVAGSLFVSIDHPDGVRTTYSWLSDVSVERGDTVSRRDPIGRSGAGHPGTDPPHLHLGARIGSTYIDPMLLLESGSLVGLVHLAPME